MDETTHKQKYVVRDLPTQSVTLFPTRAQVVRPIKNVLLKSGTNQITIVGLTPTVDEDSIKVEGAGSAVITDISVELLPNQDIFQEFYPDSDDDGKSDGNASDAEERDEPEDKKTNLELERVRIHLQALRDTQKREKEVIMSAESRLAMLDAFARTFLDREEPINLQQSIQSYKVEREKIFNDHMNGSNRDRDLNREISKVVQVERKLVNLELKQEAKATKIKNKAAKEKAKEREKEMRREEKRRKEKARIRREREQFWPRSCYTVRITLEASNYTPMSSRRSSITSVTELVKPAAPETENSGGSGVETASLFCDLSLSYMTSSAFWSPSYDLQLSTTSSTGTSLLFDSQLTNMTSETWKDCKVILSTSQTVFSGLQDAIPTLTPWRLRLGGRRMGKQFDILSSEEERAEQKSWKRSQIAGSGASKARVDLFGVSNSSGTGGFAHSTTPRTWAVNDKCTTGGLFGQTCAHTVGNDRSAVSAPWAQIYGGGSGGGLLAISSSANTRSQPAASQGFVPEFCDKEQERDESDQDQISDLFGKGPNDDRDGNYEATLLEPQPELSFQESAMEETGLTTTYDLPGQKTLAPNPTASKQRVARISFTNVAFSHTIVAKYKPVAFLKAKLRNASKLALLKGAVGITLDGAFMGHSTLPRCSSGDSFTMNLGVDPAIRVVYPAPAVKRSTSGVFNKEASSFYTRSITIVNTRASVGAKPVNLLVLDQVPVSEDEKLRVDVVHPRGMLVAGQGVSTGTAYREGQSQGEGKEDRDWGKASAMLKKGGEVSWEVVLNAGKSVKLKLEYEVSLPAGDHAVQVDKGSN